MFEVVQVRVWQHLTKKYKSLRICYKLSCVNTTGHLNHPLSAAVVIRIWKNISTLPFTTITLNTQFT